MNREQRRRENLYKNFKAGLAGANGPQVYDENDLLDIFDYANDVYDEYVQLEAILLAARLYPESEEMAQRKAYFLYGNLSMAEGAANMSRLHRGESALWAILALLVEHPAPGNCRKAMDELLARYSDFDDETAIQLVDACADLGIFDWLTGHKEELIKRCAYPETLLYEMAMEADARTDYALAASLMEELTEREPFNASVWHMLSQIYVKLDRYDDALSAIEYAIAIDAETSAYKLTKGQILYDMHTDTDKARELVESVVNSEPANQVAAHTLAAMYMLSDKPDEALKVLKAYFAGNSFEKDAVEHILMIGNRQVTAEILDRFYESTSPDEDDWSAWARSFYNRDMFLQCADIYLALLRNSSHIPEWTPMLEGLYRNGEYGTIVTLYRDYIIKATDADRIDLSVTDALVFVLSLLRCKLPLAARKLIEIVSGLDISEVFPFEKRMTAIGVRDTLRHISKIIDKGDVFDVDAFDPFVNKQ